MPHPPIFNKYLYKHTFPICEAIERNYAYIHMKQCGIFDILDIMQMPRFMFPVFRFGFLSKFETAIHNGVVCPIFPTFPC